MDEFLKLMIDPVDGVFVAFDDIPNVFFGGVEGGVVDGADAVLMEGFEVFLGPVVVIVGGVEGKEMEVAARGGVEELSLEVVDDEDFALRDVEAPGGDHGVVEEGVGEFVVCSEVDVGHFLIAEIANGAHAEFVSELVEETDRVGPTEAGRGILFGDGFFPVHADAAVKEGEPGDRGAVGSGKGLRILLAFLLPKFVQEGG